MNLIYSIGVYIAFFLLLPVLLVHPKLREGWKRRLGFYPHPFPEAMTREKSRGLPHSSTYLAGDEAPFRVWFHGASAGDLSALSPMIHELRERVPGATIIVSCLTNSGAVMANKRLGFVDAITFQPWDLPGATSRAVAAIRPDLLVLEYTEIWPNLIRAARRFGARIALTNGRFSERNVPWYKMLFAVSGHPLMNLDLLLMRTEEEAERALALGASPKSVRITGNTKFDALLVGDGREPTELRQAFGLAAGARVLVAGSTHEGEEQIVLEVYRRLLETVNDLRLVLAPRYVERVGRVVNAIERAGFGVRLRTGRRLASSSDLGQGSVSSLDGGDDGPQDDEGSGCEEGRAVGDVLVLDTIGELSTCYRLASMVFVGGSFTDRGGQNILEPAAQGKPVVFGPNMSNFRDSVGVLVGRGGIQVTDAEQLHKVLLELLLRPEKLSELGGLAQRTVRGIKGASDRNVDALLELLDQARTLSNAEAEVGQPS